MLRCADRGIGMTSAAQISNPLGSALRWWLRELATCAPTALREAVGRRLQTLIVIYGPDQVILRSGRSGKAAEIGVIDLDVADRSTITAKLKGKINLRRALIVLKLPGVQVLRRRIALPLVASENLREVIGFELDRHTPFRVEDAYYDYRVAERDHHRNRILIDIVVAPRTIADRAIEALKGWGLIPDRMSVANGDAPDDGTINLLAATTSVGQRMHVLSRVNTVLGLLAAGLVALAIYLEFHRQHQILAAYDAELAQQRAESLEADAIKKQVADLLDSGRYIQQHRKDQPLVVALLDELTQRIPDDIWLTQVRVQGDQLVLSGHAPSASTLIGLLEESSMLSQVRFTSPVTPDPKLGLERFNLSASVARDGGS